MGKHIHISKHAFSSFFERLGEDNRLLPSHIGLVMALFYYHSSGDFAEFFQASRRKLMRFSRIRSIATYHKCLSELVSYGYLEYIPSWHPIKASEFRFIEITDGKNDG